MAWCISVAPVGDRWHVKCDAGGRGLLGSMRRVELMWLVEVVGKAIDIAGVGVIALGIIVTTIRYLISLRGERKEAYQSYRKGLGRTLLLGLEFLVAADVIRTVAITPTFQNVGTLGIIVLIRTFLSWSLEVELEGRWPWQQRADKTPS